MRAPAGLQAACVTPAIAVAAAACISLLALLRAARADSALKLDDGKLLTRVCLGTYGGSGRLAIGASADAAECVHFFFFAWHSLQLVSLRPAFISSQVLRCVPETTTLPRIEHKTLGVVLGGRHCRPQVSGEGLTGWARGRGNQTNTLTYAARGGCRGTSSASSV